MYSAIHLGRLPGAAVKAGFSTDGSRQSTGERRRWLEIGTQIGMPSSRDAFRPPPRRRAREELPKIVDASYAPHEERTSAELN
jgi:hypothetical protein